MSTTAVSATTPKAAPATRVSEEQSSSAAPPKTSIFSPRSAAAMALSSISRQSSGAVSATAAPSTAEKPTQEAPVSTTTAPQPATAVQKLPTTAAKAVPPTATASISPPNAAKPMVPPPYSARRHSDPAQQTPLGAAAAPHRYPFPPMPPHIMSMPPHHPSGAPWGTPLHPNMTRRSSDPGMMPPMPPMGPYGWEHMPPFPPMAFYPPVGVMSSSHKTRPASHMHSFVTPTPKKARMGPSGRDYNRKKKSLGTLAENFLQLFEDAPQGSEVVIDRLSVELEVERRRIYDVVNILESLQIVTKKGKNAYTWMGTEHLPNMFALIQHDATFEYAQDALDNGIITVKPSQQEMHAAQANKDLQGTTKSLSKLSQEFLRCFLVGHETLSLPEASDKINKEETSMADLAKIGCKNTAPPESPTAFKQAAMRGLKTKIRRLYDCSNVFVSLGLLAKVDERSVPMDSRRPRFRWVYKLSAQHISQMYPALPQSMKDSRDPFVSVGKAEVKTPLPPLAAAPATATKATATDAASEANATEPNSSEKPGLVAASPDLIATLNQSGAAAPSDLSQLRAMKVCC